MWLLSKEILVLGRTWSGLIRGIACASQKLTKAACAAGPSVETFYKYVQIMEELEITLVKTAYKEGRKRFESNPQSQVTLKIWLYWLEKQFRR